VIKLPAPKVVDEKFYQLHGLYADQDSAGWDMTWRNFRASLFHLSLHAAFSDFRAYAPWAKAKDIGAATFAVSLVEDVHIITEARTKWPGVLPDMAYASYLSALRLTDPDEIDNSPLRLAAKLLLTSAGVFKSSGARLSREEDAEVAGVDKLVRIDVEEFVKYKSPENRTLLTKAAHEIYSAVSERGSPSEIPYFPFTEAHGACDLFDGKLLEHDQDKGESLLRSALARVGLKDDTTATDSMFISEAREVLAGVEIGNVRLDKIRAYYEGLIAPTRLDSVEFPPGDYGTFMRVRAELAGPIKNVRDQLMQVRNILDDTSGFDAGAQLDTQAVMQVMATHSPRTDVFEQLQPTYKDEAWAILIDASRSTSSFAQATRGIATCLAEIATKLMKQRTQWAMFSFNNSIQIIKDFSEDYGMTAKARIGGITQRSTTLLPDALQVAHKALKTRESDARVLVVVSDGYPSGYNNIENKLIAVIKELSKSSVFLIGVGVDSGAIKKYFPMNCVMSSPYELMKTFAKAYLELSTMF
jgi:Mg-chelatase subunit ChlD